MPAQLWRRRRGRQISVFALKRRDGSHPGRSAAQDLALRQGILAVGRSAVHFPPARSDAQGRNTCAATWKALPRFPTISGDSLWTRLCYKDDSDSDRAKSEGASGQPALVRCCEEEKPLPGSWQRNARGLFCNDTLPPDWRIHPSIGLLPDSFIDLTTVRAVFPTPKDYQTALVKDYETYFQIANRLGEVVEFNKAERESIVNQTLQKRFNGKDLNAMTEQDKGKLAIILNRNFGFNSYQISTSIFLKERVVRQLLNSKELSR